MHQDWQYPHNPWLRELNSASDSPPSPLSPAAITRLFFLKLTRVRVPTAGRMAGTEELTLRGTGQGWRWRSATGGRVWAAVSSCGTVPCISTLWPCQGQPCPLCCVLGSHRPCTRRPTAMSPSDVSPPSPRLSKCLVMFTSSSGGRGSHGCLVLGARSLAPARLCGRWTSLTHELSLHLDAHFLLLHLGEDVTSHVPSRRLGIRSTKR